MFMQFMFLENMVMVVLEWDEKQVSWSVPLPTHPHPFASADYSLKHKPP